MKMVKMIRGFSLKTSKSVKIIQNMIFYVKLQSVTSTLVRSKNEK